MDTPTSCNTYAVHSYSNKQISQQRTRSPHNIQPRSHTTNQISATPCAKSLTNAAERTLATGAHTLQSAAMKSNRQGRFSRVQSPDPSSMSQDSSQFASGHSARHLSNAEGSSSKVLHNTTTGHRDQVRSPSAHKTPYY